MAKNNILDVFVALYIRLKRVRIKNDNFKVLETINHVCEIYKTRWKEVKTLIDARVISSSHHRPFVSPSSARKNFDLSYMLLNSDESNFPRLPGRGAR